MNRDELLSSIDNIKCDSHENDDADIEILLLDSCVYLSKIALYISFNKTIYQSSFVVELIISFVAMCVFTVCAAFLLVASNTIITILGFELIECLDLIISFSVFLLFNDKLFQLILSRKNSIYNESRDSRLVDHNTKNKNLSGMSMIVSVVYFTSEIVDNNPYMLFTREIFPIMHFMDVVANFRFGLEYHHVTYEACCKKIAEKHQERQLTFETQKHINDKKDMEKNDHNILKKQQPTDAEIVCKHFCLSACCYCYVLIVSWCT